MASSGCDHAGAQPMSFGTHLGSQDQMEQLISWLASTQCCLSHLLDALGWKSLCAVLAIGMLRNPEISLGVLSSCFMCTTWLCCSWCMLSALTPHEGASSQA